MKPLIKRKKRWFLFWNARYGIVQTNSTDKPIKKEFKYLARSKAKVIKIEANKNCPRFNTEKFEAIQLTVKNVSPSKAIVVAMKAILFLESSIRLMTTKKVIPKQANNATNTQWAEYGLSILKKSNSEKSIPSTSIPLTNCNRRS
jgi:hypothetical protein